jgi:hypothetical protein
MLPFARIEHIRSTSIVRAFAIADDESLYHSSPPERRRARRGNLVYERSTQSGAALVI